MDTTPLSRSLSAPQPAAPQPQPVSVKTEVPAPQAVTAAVEVDLAPIDTLRSRAGIEAAFEARRRTERGFVSDAESDALVYRVTSEPAGTVLFQIPSDDALKLRAYLRAEGGEHEADLTA